MHSFTTPRCGFAPIPLLLNCISPMAGGQNPARPIRLLGPCLQPYPGHCTKSNLQGSLSNPQFEPLHGWGLDVQKTQGLPLHSKTNPTKGVPKIRGNRIRFVPQPDRLHLNLPAGQPRCRRAKFARFYTIDAVQKHPKPIKRHSDIQEWVEALAIPTPNFASCQFRMDCWPTIELDRPQHCRIEPPDFVGLSLLVLRLKSSKSKMLG